MSDVIRSSIFGLSHIQVPVTDLERAARFYEGGLGFPRKQEGDGWIDLDASAALLRLARVAPGGGERTALRVQVGDVDAVYRSLLAAGGCGLSPPVRTAEHEALARVGDGEGNTVIVWRPLSEDEYGYLPELPVATTTWQPEAAALLKSLLLAVPALFRALARRKVVRVAEELHPGRPIGRHEVVRAYILASARITRHRVREPLRRHGFRPEDFQAEFDAE